MKLKIFISGTLLVVFMFLATSISWADGPMWRSRSPISYEHNRGKSGNGLPQKRSTHLNKGQRRHEKPGGQAWADGKLNYRERHRLHNIRMLTGKGIKHHKEKHLDYSRGHINKKPKQPYIPRFSIDFSFSKPWFQ
jgi:hypothetical protein